MSKKKSSTRSHYIQADFTPSEVHAINKHCKAKDISVSAFLADVVLTEIHQSKKEAPRQEEITITLKVTAEEKAKIKMFAHRRDTTFDEFLEGVVRPTINKARLWFHAETKSLRYYVSPQDHHVITEYFRTKNVSARTYVSYLALEALKKDKSQDSHKK
jgi:hypothetical protein